jgi:hypothetical protein
MTTDAQLEAFTDPALARITSALEHRALAAIAGTGSHGATVDEAFALSFPFASRHHASVDSFRVAVRHLRERGEIMDSGRSRVSADSGRRQTVWCAGDDREKVTEHRRRKLRRFPSAWLRDELARRIDEGDPGPEEDYQPSRSTSSS